MLAFGDILLMDSHIHVCSNASSNFHLHIQAHETFAFYTLPGVLILNKLKEDTFS